MTATLHSPNFYRSTAEHLSAAVAAEPLNQGFSESAPAEWVPPIELHETARTLILRVELPGMANEYLEISLASDMVEIAGERHGEPHSQTNGIYQSELHYGKFQRVIPLPLPIDPTTAKADFRDGMLMLVLPKAPGDWQTISGAEQPVVLMGATAGCALKKTADRQQVGPSYWFA
jgi:HSP20 family molecular chaperone IbpA